MCLQHREFSGDRVPSAKLAAAVLLVARRNLKLTPAWRPELEAMTSFSLQDVAPRVEIASGASPSHVSATTRPCWKRHRHAIEQASRRWRGGRTRHKTLISTQASTTKATAARRRASPPRRRRAARVATTASTPKSWPSGAAAAGSSRTPTRTASNRWARCLRHRNASPRSSTSAPASRSRTCPRTASASAFASRAGPRYPTAAVTCVEINQCVGCTIVLH